MPRETARARADRLLLEGRVVLQQVQPGIVRSTVRGEGRLWHPAYSHGRWSCDCPVRSDQCSHLIALRRVTAVDIESKP